MIKIDTVSTYQNTGETQNIWKLKQNNLLKQDGKTTFLQIIDYWKVKERMSVKFYRSLTSSDIKVEKALGAVILFILTFALTLIPYKLKSIQETNLRTVKCFCGGVSSSSFIKFHSSKHLRASILLWETQSAAFYQYSCILNYFGLLNFLTFFPAGIYLLKVNNRNIRTRCEICSKLTIKATVNVVLVSLLLTLNIFHTLLYCFYCWLWAVKCPLCLFLPRLGVFSQLKFTCATSAIETLEKMWNMFKVNNKNTRDVVLVFLLLTLNMFHTFF